MSPTEPRLRPRHRERTCGDALAAISLALALPACSVIIDVPKSCDDADCVPYLCGDDGVTCGASCATDAECAEGFVCDGTAGRCEPTGCIPLGPAVALQGLPGVIGEFDAAIGYGDGAQMLLLVANQSKLGMRRFTVEGGLVRDLEEPEPAPITNDVIELANENAQRQSFLPRIDFLPPNAGGSGFAEPRYLMSWRTVGGGGGSGVTTASFMPTFPSIPSPVEAVAERGQTLVTAHSIAPTPTGMLATWTTRFESRGGAFAIGADDDGRVAESDSRASLADEERLPALIAAPRQRDATFVTFTTSGSGTRNLIGVAVDSAGQRIGDFQLRSERPATTFEIADLASANMDDTSALAWLERDSGAGSVHVVTFDAATTSNLSPTATLVIPTIEVAPGFTDIGAARVGEAAGGFAVAWTGTRAGRFDLWVQRFGTNGVTRYRPVPAAGVTGSDIQDFQIVPTSEGFSVFWLSKADVAEGQGADTISMRRFLCAE